MRNVLIYQAVESVVHIALWLCYQDTVHENMNVFYLWQILIVYYQLFRFLAIVFTGYKLKLGFFDIIDITSLLCALKGPKREIFGFGIFAQIRPICMVSSELGPKIQKSYIWGLILPFISLDFCLSAAGDSAKKKKKFELGGKKKLIQIASIITL